MSANKLSPDEKVFIHKLSALSKEDRRALARSLYRLALVADPMLPAAKRFPPITMTTPMPVAVRN